MAAEDTVGEGAAARRPRAGEDAAGGSPGAREARPLSELLATLERWSHEREGLASAVDAGLPAAAEWPALPALDGAQALWAQLRNREQLRQALAPAPADAGPLNSRALVARMLQLMQAQSPGYLRQFTAYVDALASLQDQQGREAPDAAGGGAGAAPPRKRARARAGRGASRPPAGAT